MRGLFLTIFVLAAAAASPSLALDLTNRGALLPVRTTAFLPQTAASFRLPGSGVSGFRPAPFSPSGSQLRAWSMASQPFQRVRLEYARENFYTGEAGGKFGLGQGFAFNQDLIGAKLAFLGDERSKILPQIALGLQYRRTEPLAVYAVLGGRKRKDYYASATKLLFGKSVMVSGAMRLTKLSRQGMYGLGPTRNMQRRQFELSAAWTPTAKLAMGIEHRTGLGNSVMSQNKDWNDVFVAYAFNKHLSINAALVDRSHSLGTGLPAFANLTRVSGPGERRNERGAFLTVQAGF